MKKSLGILAALTMVGGTLMTPAQAAQSDQIVHILDSVATSFVPSESAYSDGTLWGLNSTYGINAAEVFDVSQGSRDVVVGIIDTGITSHSDLNANVISGYDFVSNTTYAGDGDGRDSNPADPGDYYTNAEGFHASSWHGTHVAGIVGAISNGVGALGVSPTVSIMPLRALGRGGGLLTDVNDAITWGSGGTLTSSPRTTVTKRADVLSLSLGNAGEPCPPSTQAAIDGAVSRGTVVVVAAGNSGVDLTNTYPANCNNVVTVIATSADGSRPSWSNFGSVASATNSIYVSAPGEAIYSTYNSGSRSPGAESYQYMSGTSMATPFVSGIVAQIRAVKPTASVAEIKGLLNDPANRTTGTRGTSIIDAGKLLRSLSGVSSAQTNSPVAPTAPTIVVEAPVVVVDPVPIIDPVIAPAPLTFTVKKKYSAKNFAAQSGVNVPSKSTISLKVSSGKKFCRITSGKLQTLKAGSCTVSVKVKTKVKVGKKYKYKTTTTKVALVVQ